MFSSARCLFFAGLTYLAYTVIFLAPLKYELEIVSAIVGFGAAGEFHFRIELFEFVGFIWFVGSIWFVGFVRIPTF